MCYLKDLTDSREAAHSEVHQLGLNGQLDLFCVVVHIQNAGSQLLVLAILLLPFDARTCLQCTQCLLVTSTWCTVNVLSRGLLFPYTTYLIHICYVHRFSKHST